MKTEILGKIKDNKISYESGYQSKVNKFKFENPNCKIIMSFEVNDDPLYHQHKYYRGTLLPDIADAMGEKDLQYVHIFVLKKEFLYIDVDSFDQIPAKYRSKAFVFYRELNKFNNKSVESETRVEVIGFVPSTSDLTKLEFDEFIKKCEDRLFIDLDGHTGQGDTIKNQQEHIDLRNKVIDMFKGGVIK